MIGIFNKRIVEDAQIINNFKDIRYIFKINGKLYMIACCREHLLKYFPEVIYCPEVELITEYNIKKSEARLIPIASIRSIVSELVPGLKGAKSMGSDIKYIFVFNKRLYTINCNYQNKFTYHPQEVWCPEVTKTECYSFIGGSAL